MKLVIARHGETDSNAERRYTGGADLPLNAAGIKQARELARLLSGEKFDFMVSSPMIRARRTSDIVAGVLGMKYAVYDEFAERRLGVYEGLTREEAQARYPDLWNRQCTSKPDDAPDGGETLRAFCERVDSGLERVKREFSGSALIICHGAVSRAVNRYCLNLSFDDMLDFFLGNCETRKYEI